MSASASINISIAKRREISFSVVDIIKILLNNGWNIINDNKILYLPLGDNDKFDWQYTPMNENDFFDLIKQKELATEIIGVGLIWENSSIGGTILINSSCDILFSLTINRKKIFDDVTDVNWYLERLLTFFETDLVTVESFSFKQY